LGGDGGGEGVGEFVDLVGEVGEDALGFGAAADGCEFGGDGAEVVGGAADLDEAVVQFVDGFGVLVGILVVVEVFVDAVVDGLVAAGRWLLVMGGQRGWRLQRRRSAANRARLRPAAR
jgi:hypothetical protein